MKQKEIDEKLLIDYLNGKTKEADSRKVEDWYAASPENSRALEQLYYILFINERVQVMKTADTESYLAEFKSMIANKRGRKALLKHRKRRLYAIAGTAAAFAAMVAIVVIMGVKTSEFASNPFVAMTQTGERVMTVLPDGTKAWMNSCSTLEYSSSPFNRERKVNMTGEVYFEVAKKGNSTFIVHSAGLSTRVLGTRFNIRTDEDNKIVTATLIEGSILLSGKMLERDIKLRPNEQFIYHMDRGYNRYSTVNALASVAWMDGKLHFEETTLGDIARELERYYNVDIYFDDESLKYERFSGDFETADNIQHILSMLKMTGKFGYVTDSKKITITRP